MSQYLKDTFTKSLPLKITTKHFKSIRAMVVNFETRKQHALTLNSQLIGVHPISFTTQDSDEIFQIFGYDKDTVTSIQNTIKYPNNTPVINRDFNVTGDTLNIFITWILHCVYISTELSAKQKTEMLIDVTKLWQYKFFTSLIHNSFPYKCNESVMKAAIHRLTMQSDIIKYGTWTKVLYEQARKITDETGIHKRTIREYHDDNKVFYFISDTQTRVRDKIKNIVSIFMTTKSTGDAIKSYSPTSEVDGTKILINQTSIFDMMINNGLQELINVNTFIDDKALRIVSSVFKNLKPDMLKYLMIKFSEIAASQLLSGELDRVDMIKRTEIYTGARILVNNIIQKSYRHCIQEQIPLNNKLAILIKIKNIYSSSRIADKDLVKIKESVGHFVYTNSKSVREATNSSMKIAFILYIIFKTFRYL